MSIPLVSVIMTAYNCEKYLEEALSSIYSQTFIDFEIIFYDDASTDDTWRTALNFFKKSNTKFMGKHVMRRGMTNVGCGEGRNRAISLSKSKYIMIQDADDYSMPHRLEQEVHFMEAHDDIFCVGGLAIKVDEKGDFVEPMEYPPKMHEDIYNEMMVKKNNPIIDPSCMFKREVFNELGGYSKQWRLIPDFNLWVRAAIAGYKFHNIEDHLVQYRQHPNSITNKHEMAVVREHFDMCKQLLAKAV